MKKYIANIVTASRAVFSLPLLCIPLSSAWFYVIYLFCGLTDMVDGTIARRMGAVSAFGARLDTVSDLVFVLICGAKILPLLRIPMWLWVWIIWIALMKIGNLTCVLIRKKKLISIHSALNKITGFALFLLPLSLHFVEAADGTFAICVLATAAGIEEIFLTARGREAL